MHLQATFAEPYPLAQPLSGGSRMWRLSSITHQYFGDLGLDIIVPLGVPVLPRCCMTTRVAETPVLHVRCFL